MSLTWRNREAPAPPRPGASGLLRALLRGGPLLILLGVGLAVSLLLRAVEAPFARRRGITPWVTVRVCGAALRLLGLSVQVSGRPTPGPCILAVNHSSWLDILVLNAQGTMVFVSKAEVAGWPGIGWLARATGTLFIRREARSEVAVQARAVADRLRSGGRLVLFPEGTSTDNQRVLPFRSPLLAGLLSLDGPAEARLQPVTLSYSAPEGEDPRFYAWYGDSDLGPHLLAVLASRRPGGVAVTFHRPIPAKGRDRKSLALEAEEAVRSAL